MSLTDFKKMDKFREDTHLMHLQKCNESNATQHNDCHDYLLNLMTYIIVFLSLPFRINCDLFTVVLLSLRSTSPAVFHVIKQL